MRAALRTLAVVGGGVLVVHAPSALCDAIDRQHHRMAERMCGGVAFRRCRVRNNLSGGRVHKSRGIVLAAVVGDTTHIKHAAHRVQNALLLVSGHVRREDANERRVVPRTLRLRLGVRGLKVARPKSRTPVISRYSVRRCHRGNATQSVSNGERRNVVKFIRKRGCADGIFEERLQCDSLSHLRAVEGHAAYAHFNHLLTIAGVDECALRRRACPFQMSQLVIERFRKRGRRARRVACTHAHGEYAYTRRFSEYSTSWRDESFTGWNTHRARERRRIAVQHYEKVSMEDTDQYGGHQYAFSMRSVCHHHHHRRHHLLLLLPPQKKRSLLLLHQRHHKKYTPHNIHSLKNLSSNRRLQKSLHQSSSNNNNSKCSQRHGSCSTPLRRIVGHRPTRMEL
mmetsp:Transcript_414/g.865  ORF Transcript_414/g.865 Transcript_414/m.865 type:complete len:396 (+) Transcript_414:345-1532(+)